MERRIVTDGEVFRVQFKVMSFSEWEFYTGGVGEFQTREKAETFIAGLEEKDRRDAPERWTAVE